MARARDEEGGGGTLYVPLAGNGAMVMTDP